MKAKIISQKVYEGLIDHLHGGSAGYIIKRLIVEEKNNLAITLHQASDQVYAITGFSRSDCNALGEIEVPDDLVEKALAFVRAKADLDGCKDMLKKLLGNDSDI